ncbi:MAG: hypothetical protein ACLQU2_03180 [Candidatus Binataceae bacterium]
MRHAKCRGCGADILWAKTLAGKAVPLDAKPEKRFVLTGMSEDGVKLIDSYLSHFVTCPQAAAFRKESAEE